MRRVLDSEYEEVAGVDSVWEWSTSVETELTLRGRNYFSRRVRAFNRGWRFPKSLFGRNTFCSTRDIFQYRNIRRESDTSREYL